MSKDSFGGRMKMYEKAYSTKCMPLLPICVRLDGKGFSKWTKGLRRPYDEELVNIMVGVTEYLVKETQAAIGYTQSDEISLIYYANHHGSQLFFDGKLQKMCSVLTSMCTMKFNELFVERKIMHDRFMDKPWALFDCRVWQVPTLQEAVNYLIWREQDATKNSITMAASTVYSHKQLHKKSGKEKMDMLMEKGINWNDYPFYFKRGVYIRKTLVKRKIAISEIETLPELHEARRNPDKEYKRWVISSEELPRLSSVENAVEVLFA